MTFVIDSDLRAERAAEFSEQFARSEWSSDYPYRHGQLEALVESLVDAFDDGRNVSPVTLASMAGFVDANRARRRSPASPSPTPHPLVPVAGSESPPSDPATSPTTSSLASEPASDVGTTASVDDAAGGSPVDGELCRRPGEPESNCCDNPSLQFHTDRDTAWIEQSCENCGDSRDAA